MNYKYIRCKKALHKLDAPRPYSRDLNLYRGCGHDCKYCFARYSHKYLQNTPHGYGDEGLFERDIYIKSNVIEVLGNELHHWQRKGIKQVVNVGGVTDAYQPIEKKEQLMPRVIELFTYFQIPMILSTKSDLILRDIQLLSQLANLVPMHIAFTITTLDETLQRKIEPAASATTKRLEALKMLAEGGVQTGLHLMPVIPFLTDSQENIESIFELGKKAHVQQVLCGILYLREPTKTYFLEYIRMNHPNEFEPMVWLYSTPIALEKYKEKKYAEIHALREKIGIKSTNGQSFHHWNQSRQINEIPLFPL